MSSKKIKKVFVYSSKNFVISSCSKLLDSYVQLVYSSECDSNVNFYDYLKSQLFDLIIVDVSSISKENLELLFGEYSKIDKNKLFLLVPSTISCDYMQIIYSNKMNYVNFPCDGNLLKKVLLEHGEFDVRPEPCVVSQNKFSLNYIDKRFIGKNIGIEKVKNLLANVASTEMTILFQGESGTGKNLLAEIANSLSKRNDKELVVVNMADIPENLVDSELFGTVVGAFTGSVNRRGYFSEANHGTLFLDEIADLPLSVQSKLLRVLETGKFRRIGSSREETVDVRFMCASNQNLKQLVFEGRFRKDLYYRIADIVIEIPPLRDRMDDIKMLVDYFLDKNISITDEAVRKLSEYLWPGNVREFVKCIKRAIVLGDGKVVREENIIF